LRSPPVFQIDHVRKFAFTLGEFFFLLAFVGQFLQFIVL
jgi:hypothetical protein